jgi:cob(I)alamin adenosyltransferase
MPIYTRTGDKGKTSLFDGTRVLKSHPRVDTYGTIDELNSTIGHVIAHLRAQENHVKKELEKIQHDLFDIGSALATPHPLPVTGLDKRPKEFEAVIDAYTSKMPEIKYFILPGGGKAGSLLHVARTITRRAERQLVILMQKEEIDQAIVIYLNRLSDLLFTMARFVNYKEKKKEIQWIKK